MIDYRPTKLFTLDEANRSLPLVKVIVQDMAELAHAIVERRQRIRLLIARRDGRSDPYLDELAEIETQLEQEESRLEEFAQELLDLGVEPKGAVEGLADFPAEHQGRVVYLCWKLGEPAVQHWHEVSAGYAGRQLILPKDWEHGVRGPATVESA